MMTAPGRPRPRRGRGRTRAGASRSRLIDRIGELEARAREARIQGWLQALWAVEAHARADGSHRPEVTRALEEARREIRKARAQVRESKRAAREEARRELRRLRERARDQARQNDAL